MKTVAVIFGGQSTEHDISIVTAISSIIKPLQAKGGYDVVPVYIAKDGKWYSDEKLGDIAMYSSGKIADYLHNTKPISIELGNGLSLVKTTGLTGRKVVKNIDVVFPSMHGTKGEDGALMGLLDMAGVPYVGCGMTASALAMDKVLAKLIVESHKIPTPEMQFFTREEYEYNPQNNLDHLKSWISNNKITYPLFVKPAHLGSSIGISKVMKYEELNNAIEVALHYDDLCIVEQGVNNLIELTLPIMGNGNDLQHAYLEKPLAKDEQFFDFETKYMNGGGKKGGKKMGNGRGAQGYSELPAKIDKALYQKALDVALKVFTTLGCSGTARVDLLVDSKTGIVYFNEINPLPGSLYAHNWRAAGVSNVELVDKLIQLAEDKFNKAKSKNLTFNTNFLKQF
jgi:D-alanine-D-alanine ligase